MAKVRDIIVHVEVEVAERARICHHNRKDHEITKGEQCLAIYDHDGGRKNYCGACALAIVVKAKAKLLSMERTFQS